MDVVDFDTRLNSVKAMLDDLSKDLQHIIQTETERAPEGTDPDVQPLERCVARTSSVTLMISDISHDLEVIKLNVSTLYDLLGCKKEEKKPKKA